MTFSAVRKMARFFLKNALHMPLDFWTAQGFGFLRLRISPTLRLHVWDARLRAPTVSDMHDHLQWSFVSSIISGQIINQRFEEMPENIAGGVEYHMQELKAGIGGGPVGERSLIRLRSVAPDLYSPGQTYAQESAEIHRTMATDGTVTLIEQVRTGSDMARVFWPKGTEWGNALPRAAEKYEVSQVTEYALAQIEEE